MLQGDAPSTAVSLLEDDLFLWRTILEGINTCRHSITKMLDAVAILYAISSASSAKQKVTFTDLYIKAVSGDLYGSAMMRDQLLSMRKMKISDISRLLENILLLDLHDSSLHSSLAGKKIGIDTLQQGETSQQDKDGDERTSRCRTMRTSIVDQRVELTETISFVREKPSRYTELVDSIDATLQSYLKDSLRSPQDFFLHEIFFFDMRLPSRDVLGPKPRFAIERALLHPRDYLECDCCEPAVEGLAATQPATAILYQLYLESGTLINVFDLWSAFYAVVGGEDGEDCDAVNALYTSSLLHLRALISILL